MIDFGIIDVVDILATALLLYYIYSLMKASSSANIFMGILVFVVMWFVVAKVFEMRLMGGIMSSVVNVGGVALVVLFQEEIRHFFSTLGTRHRAQFFTRLFSKNREEKSHKAEIIPIVMALMNMSRQKVGALVVIARSAPLTDVAHTGEIINADINQRLIENIFFKNSPLHDGAMVIVQGRIRAAGCILPVAHDSDIPKALGLRHRAALGISQKTDCIALIVSEETGGISAAIGGSFRLRLTPEELERLLTSEWVD